MLALSGVFKFSAKSITLIAFFAFFFGKKLDIQENLCYNKLVKSIRFFRFLFAKRKKYFFYLRFDERKLR